MSFNDRIYGQFIAGSVPGVEQADRRWLGNQMAKIHRKKGFGCRNNFRLCLAGASGGTNRRYSDIAQNGCCGVFDTKLTNHQTGQSFWYGFNYGH